MSSAVVNLAALAWVAAAVIGWRPRVPGQNLWLAAAWVVVGLFLLAVGLGTTASWSQPWPGVSTTAALVALAGLFNARLAAGWLCRSWRGTPNFGLGLNLLAAGLMAVPVGLALWLELGPSTRSRLGPGWFGVIVLGWSLATLLLTLPCWLDKRRSMPATVLPWPFWPVLAWVGLTLWAWFYHQRAGR